MQGKYFYEYAIIRLVPKVEREEFLNVGIIIFCKKPEFIKALFHINEEKLRLFSSEIQIEEIAENLLAISKICDGAPGGGPMAKEDPASRFRWLTAVRSSSIQTSRPHAGFSENLDQTLQKLLEEQVL